MKVKGIAGAVLAGGKSRRLGQDKARVNYKGQDLLGGAVTLLEQLADPVFISGRNSKDHGLSNPWLADSVKGKGPIGGIITVLRQTEKACLFLSCDLPLMDRPTLERLLAVREGASDQILMTTFRQIGTGFIESLVAVYEHESLPFLEDAVASGVFKLSAAIPENRRLHIDYDPASSKPFFNLNFPRDLKYLKSIEKVTIRSES